MKWSYCLLLAISALLIAVSTQAQDSWEPVLGPDESFVVEMPAEPIRETKPIGAAGGPSYLLYSYTLIHRGERFAAQTFLLQPPLVVSEPRMAVQKIADSVAPTLAGGKWQKVTWLDMPMATAVASTGMGADGQVLRGFFAVKGSRFFVLLFGGPPGSEVEPNAERFFKSFQIR